MIPLPDYLRDIAQEILHENDAAIGYIRKEMSAEAISLLENALKRLPATVLCGYELYSCNNPLCSMVTPHVYPKKICITESPSLASVDTDSMLFSRGGDSPSKRTLGEVSLCRSPSNLFSIFTRAFKFSENNSALRNHREVVKLLNHIRPVLLFNLGLAFHHVGIRNGDYRDLAISQRYYNMAVSEIQSLAYHTGPAPTLSVVLMASYNNLGYLHSHHCDDLGSYVYYRLIYTAVVSLSSFPASLILTEDEYVFFVVTLLLSDSGSSPIAPAA